MHKDQPEKKIKRKYFLLRIAHDLVTQFAIQWYKFSTLPRNIKTAIVICGFVSDLEENTMHDPEDYKVISRKQRCCHVCSRSRDVKIQFVCKGCGHTFAKTIWIWLLLVTLARIMMKMMNLISCVVFPTLLLLQIILPYLHSWIQKWILNITGIHIPYRVNDNHVIVTWVCHFSDVKLLFFCQ
jgi:ribosomal protein L37AE/L43A